MVVELSSDGEDVAVSSKTVSGRGSTSSISFGSACNDIVDFVVFHAFIALVALDDEAGENLIFLHHCVCVVF